MLRVKMKARQMELKQGTLADGYTILNGEIGIFSNDPEFLLAELIEVGAVNVETFGVDELKAVLETTAKYKVYYPHDLEAVEYWLPDIRRRLDELARPGKACLGGPEQ